jgi:hypothetical protein
MEGEPRMTTERFYQPVAVRDGYRSLTKNTKFDHFAIRGQGGHRHRMFAADLFLTHRQADLLCDVFEEVREYARWDGAEE